MSTPHQKLDNLRSLLSEMRSVLVTFSGGADSAFLLRVAVDQLGEKAVAVTAHSEIYKQSECDEAVAIARRIGARHIVIRTNELGIDVYRSNPKDRCYHCKSHLFESIRNIQKENGLACLLDGTNHDDITDFRPGMTAASEFGVRSPLKEVGLTKQEIRDLSRELGLSTWDKPAQPCLSSRFPYGTALTDEALRRVEKAEAYLSELGLIQLRVRVDGEGARIETSLDGMQLLSAPRIYSQVVKHLTSLGFREVNVDPEGYRMGSLNESSR